MTLCLESGHCSPPCPSPDRSWPTRKANPGLDGRKIMGRWRWGWGIVRSRMLRRPHITSFSSCRRRSKMLTGPSGGGIGNFPPQSSIQGGIAQAKKVGGRSGWDEDPRMRRGRRRQHVNSGKYEPRGMLFMSARTFAT
jgi:hypothetical protein